MTLSSILNTFSEDALRELLELIKDRTCFFPGPESKELEPSPIYLRFDIDDNIDKANRMAKICHELGIRATFFMLNTAPYWGSVQSFRIMQNIQSLGHEIGWHNNILTEYAKWATAPAKEASYYDIGKEMRSIINRFADNDLIVRGSASHGDRLCRELGYLNYDVFTECERTSEAMDFPNKFKHPFVDMKYFGLEYEAYHVPYDLYLSESGGKKWKWRVESVTGENILDDDLNKNPRIQILIHPQHWKI